MHSIKACFDRIVGVLREVVGSEEVTKEGNLLRPGPKPRFSDMEVIALSLTSEALGIDSENLLFFKLACDYKTEFPNLISRRQYNDRRKLLFDWQEVLRDRMATRMNALSEIFVIDSMPLEICKLARAERNKMGQDVSYAAPDKGYCASQGKYYFGYKLHSVCSAEGVIQSLDLTRASVHDVYFLQDVKNNFKDCMIIGDKGYISKEIKAELLSESNVKLEVPPRNNQTELQTMMYVLKKTRKRIETVFSQLCDQFMMQRNYAKSFQGFRTRILAKITGMTILQYLNKFINEKPVGRIKHALYYASLNAL